MHPCCIPPEPHDYYNILSMDDDSGLDRAFAALDLKDIGNDPFPTEAAPQVAIASETNSTHRVHKNEQDYKLSRDAVIELNERIESASQSPFERFRTQGKVFSVYPFLLPADSN